MKFHGYDVEPEYIKTGVSIPVWRAAGLGEFIVGKKDGIRWFIKRNNEYRFPTAKDEPDKELRDMDLIPAQEYQRSRKELRRLMVDVGRLSMEKDRIVVEEEHFLSDKRIVIVSRFVEGVVKTVRFTDISAAEFIRFCADLAALIAKLHASGVIHGDLKVGRADSVMNGNIVATKEGGVLTPYLIDFDMSYPAPPAKNPKGIPHSENYESPELIPYIDDVDDGLTTITPATDIFTLGICFHQLWTGSFPALEVEKSSVGRCVAAGKKITLNGKFDVKIGDKYGATLISLINWMFAKNPAVRPTAAQVVLVLRDELDVPEIYHKGRDDKPFTELWDLHKPMAEISVSYLKGLGITGFKRITDGGAYKYIVQKDGKEKWATIEELFAAGMAKRKDADISEPWAEHNIEFASPAAIAAKGFVEIRRTIAGGHRYKIIKNTGLEFSHGYEWLLEEGLAKRRATTPVEGDKPWPKHGEYASEQYLAERGIIKILRVKYGAEQRYRVEYKAKPPLDNVNLDTMKRLRLIR